VKPSLPYATGSDTSQAAAASIVGVANELRAKVFRCILGAGTSGRTCDEVEEVLDMRHQTASARVNELMKLTVIVDSGQRRKTRSGRNASVWIAASLAPAALEFEPSAETKAPAVPAPPVGTQMTLLGDLDGR